MSGDGLVGGLGGEVKAWSTRVGLDVLHECGLRKQGTRGYLNCSGSHSYTLQPNYPTARVAIRERSQPQTYTYARLVRYSYEYFDDRRPPPPPPIPCSPLPSLARLTYVAAKPPNRRFQKQAHSGGKVSFVVLPCDSGDQGWGEGGWPAPGANFWIRGFATPAAVLGDRIPSTESCSGMGTNGDGRRAVLLRMGPEDLGLAKL